MSAVLAATLLLSASCTKPAEEEASAPAPVQVTAVTQATIRRIVAGDGTVFPQNQASIVPEDRCAGTKILRAAGRSRKTGPTPGRARKPRSDSFGGRKQGRVGAVRIQFSRDAGRNRSRCSWRRQKSIWTQPATLAMSPRKCWTAGNNCSGKAPLSGRQVDESQLAYTQAEGQYKAAEEHWKTLQSVAKEEQIKGAAAQMESAQAHYQSQEAQVAYSRVVSPISGVISDRPLNAGEMANPGTPMLTVMDIARVVARVNVPQAESGTVKVGQTAILTQSR